MSLRKEGRMRFTVLKLKTKRVDHPLIGDLYGRAYLSYPGGGVVDIVSESIRPGHPLERTGKEDDVWELRVIVDALGRLDSETWKFVCLTDATPRPYDEGERTWLMVYSAD